MRKKLRRAFVPEDHNNYTPSLLQRVAMGGMALLVVLSFTATNIQALLWQSSDWLVGAVLPAVVTSLTNEERFDVAMMPLLRSTLLDAAAQKKAEHMAAESYFSHYSPGGISPWYWFQQVGYTYVHAGENLAVHFSDSDEVVKAWMNSPTHRANIVNNNYTEIGIGVARGKYEGYETVFVVQMFGAPGLPPPLPPITATAQIGVSTITSTTSQASTTVVAIDSSSSVLGIETFTQTPDSMAAKAVLVSSDEPVTTSPAQALVVSAPVEIESVNEMAVFPFISEKSRTTAYQSDTIATSTNLDPAPATLASSQPEAPLFGTLATQPNSVLQYVYIVVGSLTALLLLASIIMGWRKHTLTQVWYGVGLLLVISVLFYIHVLVTSGANII